MLNSATKKKIKVLIADISQITMDAIKKGILKDSDISIIGEARNVKNAVKLLNGVEADIIILDAYLQMISNFNIIEYIHNYKLKTKVLLINVQNDKRNIPLEFKENIDTLLLQEKGIDDLIKTIKSIYNNNKCNIIKNKNPVKGCMLTPREIEIIKLISEGDTSPEIGEKLFISKHTVLTHRKNILSKLNLKNGSQIVRYAINCGWA
ncbi:response regulator transcription factor [Chondrinema litorale]|uniref:response regulator transcription factor n=1 Tax=Chondrinema litorale TaxID=2994555 RepID=UPI00254280D5|nr:response regulator transcription factor [Chondrinema litorale]UZS00204.1 response regulator transcription factor [Chondrinema litorale]